MKIAPFDLSIIIECQFISSCLYKITMKQITSPFQKKYCFYAGENLNYGKKDHVHQIPLQERERERACVARTNEMKSSFKENIYFNKNKIITMRYVQ